MKWIRQVIRVLYPTDINPSSDFHKHLNEPNPISLEVLADHVYPY